MNTQNVNIDLTALEEILSQLKNLKKENEHKEIEVQTPINSMQEARCRINRLENLFPDTNFDLLWKDRVSAIIGHSTEAVRLSLLKRMVKYNVPKNGVSWYEAVDHNKEYKKQAIKVVHDLESEYHILDNLYREGKMTQEEQSQFDMIEVPKLKSEELFNWYERRCQKFVVIGASFSKALGLGKSSYKDRIFGDMYYGCSDIFGLSPSDCVKNMDMYSEETQEKLKRYMVIVARSCLVL